MLEKWCQHSSYTELPQTFNLLKKKKKKEYLQSTVKQGMRVLEIQF